MMRSGEFGAWPERKDPFWKRLLYDDRGEPRGSAGLFLFVGVPLLVALAWGWLSRDGDPEQDFIDDMHDDGLSTWIYEMPDEELLEMGYAACTVMDQRDVDSFSAAAVERGEDLAGLLWVMQSAGENLCAEHNDWSGF